MYERHSNDKIHRPGHRTRVASPGWLLVRRFDSTTPKPDGGRDASAGGGAGSSGSAGAGGRAAGGGGSGGASGGNAGTSAGGAGGATAGAAGTAGGAGTTGGGAGSDGGSIDDSGAEADVARQQPELVAYYKFAETGGTQAADSSGKGNNATLNGQASFAGGALFCNGVVGSFAALPAAILSGTADFTILTWVNLNARDNWSRIFDFGTSSTTSRCSSRPQNGGPGPPDSASPSPAAARASSSSTALHPCRQCLDTLRCASGNTGRSGSTARWSAPTPA